MTRRLADDAAAGVQRTGSGGRIIFADQLRGLAALSVVISHLGGVFILMGPMVGWVTSAPEVHVGQPAILGLTGLHWLNLGALGVAVFFLISGFVVPFSLRSLGSGRFLVARAFRIFPTFWAALLVEWLLVAAQSLFYGRGMAFPPGAYVQDALLLDATTGAASVDLVHWTLAIEVKFYILLAILRPWILGGRAAPLIGFSLFALVVGLARTHDLLHITPQLANEPACIGFMLIGTVFHHHMTGLMSLRRAIGTGAALAGLFVVCWGVGPIRDQFPYATVNYLYGLAIFGLGYALRRRLAAVRWLDFLAGVSFPLYLIHSVVGYSSMTFMIRILGLPYGIALPAALAILMLSSWILHGVVERPSMAAGKRLARSFNQRDRATIEP